MLGEYILIVLSLSNTPGVSTEMLSSVYNLSSNSTDRTALNIHRWVESNIDYEYYKNPRGIVRTWDEKKGDCTDKAILKCRMMYLSGIKCRTVHGYGIDGLKHDWIEYNNGTRWINIEPESKRVGRGIW